ASARVKWWRPAEYYGTSRWRGTRALDGGGALINQGIHTVDLLVWLLGDARRVYARAKAALHAIETEDTIVATLEMESGALATFEATTAAYPGYPRQVELTGTEGTVVIQQNRILRADLRTPRPDLAGSEADANPSASSPTVSDVRGHQAALEDFLSAIRDGTPPRCPGPAAAPAPRRCAASAPWRRSIARREPASPCPSLAERLVDRERLSRPGADGRPRDGRRRPERIVRRQAQRQEAGRAEIEAACRDVALADARLRPPEAEAPPARRGEGARGLDRAPGGGRE